MHEKTKPSTHRVLGPNQVHGRCHQKNVVDRIVSLCLGSLSSTALSLGLLSPAIALLQPGHACLADLGIPGIECLQIIWVDDRGELNLRSL
jgi:hypothetical protein